MTDRPRRVGLFGGTFDPPHAGHLAVACAARDALDLDVVELVPSSVPPHRRAPGATPAERLEMVRLACAGEPRLVASDREIRRDGTSYTVDTLRELAHDHPGAELFLVLGADSYDELPTWRESAEIVRLAHLAVLPRPGAHGVLRLRPDDAARLRAPGDPRPAEGTAVFAVPMPLVPLAARDLRARLARGEDPGAGLAAPVFGYIRERGLYGWPLGVSMSETSSAWDPVLAAAVRALSSRKAERLSVLDLRDKSSFTDFFVICSGTSDRQVKSLAEETALKVKEETGRRAVVEGLAQGEWVLLDYGDFLVHVFSEHAREFYRLESLWGDAPRLDPAGASL